jgi:hypothetical protein
MKDGSTHDTGKGRDRRPRRLLWLAPAAAIVIAAAIITPLTLGSHNSPSGLAFSWYRAGDCLTGNFPVGFAQEWPPGRKVDCDASHEAEVFYANFQAWPSGSQYPGRLAVADRAFSVCKDQWAPYSSDSTPEGYFYVYTVLWPQDAAAWDAGQRYIACVASNSPYSSQAQLVGPLPTSPG